MKNVSGKVAGKTATNGLGNVLARGKETIRAEAKALLNLADNLSGEFDRAVAAMIKASNSGGRVIISGVGKSGYIGRKISSTLSSLGCPSFFVHPTEASHGDLGMVQQGDLLLAISNSGESPELYNLLDFCKSHHLTIIAITARAGNTLARLATINLFIGDDGEAGGAGLSALAPTNSTTKSLALGDALAMGFLEQKGFTEQQFHRLHPGGKLGDTLAKKLRTVAAAMHGDDAMPLVGDDLLMQEAILQMAQKRFGAIGIKNDQGDLLGLITDGDMRRALDKDSKGFLTASVTAIMNRRPLVCLPQTLVASVLAVMTEKKFQVMFVVTES
ncbi:MAG: KpsF/GutQ family sugar-phosphate isomerase, partial [Alphaproteobacteria bacterium]|nr:KpsF/GutQ family sugar-phosphate isomerase [Alphaproteobacteria bacterium]